MSRLTLLDSDKSDFPNIDLALTEPDGLLAVGGDLSPERIVQAYIRGIFPWYEQGQPILWWSPNPRMVLYPEDLHISRSLKKTLRKNIYQVTTDQDFEGVLKGCAESRQGQSGTWITPEMHEAYHQLYHLGIAHSVEAWYEGRLVGGLYGIALGKVFFGESMFCRRTDASKVAFVTLVQNIHRLGYQMIDCQVFTHHLSSLGAIEIPRSEFKKQLEKKTTLPIQPNDSQKSLTHSNPDIESLIQSTQWFDIPSLYSSEPKTLSDKIG